MDRKTFNQIKELHAEADELARVHEPPADQETNGATPGQRFQALGRTVMSGDGFPITDEFGAKVYRVYKFLPEGINVTLVAEMSQLVDHPTVEDLVTVSAEWGVAGKKPLHVDSVSNVSDRYTDPSDEYTLNKLAAVEESFAEAEQKAAV
jgi:hypothetical protein